jgi:hypothetical protein
MCLTLKHSRCTFQINAFTHGREICLIQRTTVLETEQTWPILSRPKLKHVTVLRKYNNKLIFCVHIILLEGVFVTHLSGNAGISV